MAMNVHTKREIALSIVRKQIAEAEYMDVVEHEDMKFSSDWEIDEVFDEVQDLLSGLRDTLGNGAYLENGENLTAIYAGAIKGKLRKS